jgi:hypothetical protein
MTKRKATLNLIRGVGNQDEYTSATDLFGKGLYLTDSQEVADFYGEKTQHYEVSAAIFDTTKEFTREQLESVLNKLDAITQTKSGYRIYKNILDWNEGRIPRKTGVYYLNLIYSLSSDADFYRAIPQLLPNRNEFSPQADVCTVFNMALSKMGYDGLRYLSDEVESLEDKGILGKNLYLIFNSNENNVKQIDSFKRGGGIASEQIDLYTFEKVKKAYVSIKINREIERLDKLSYEYSVTSVDEKPFTELSNHVLEGIKGVSVSKYNVAEWLSFRDCLVVMPFEDFYASNDTEQIEYENAEYLTKNGLDIMFRIYDRKSKDDYSYYSVLQNLFPKIAAEFNLELSVAKDSRLYTIYAICDDIFNVYNSGKFLDFCSKLPRFNSVADFAKAVVEYNNSGKFKSEYYYNKEFPLDLSIQDVESIIEKGIVSAIRIYRTENEWIINDQNLVLPVNTQLFFVLGETKNLKETYLQLIEKYNLNETYKIGFIKQKDVEKFRNVYNADAEKRFQENLKISRNKVEKKISEAISQVFDEIYAKIKSAVSKEASSQYAAPFKDYDDTSIEYEDIFLIPDVAKLDLSFDTIMLEAFEYYQKSIVEQKDKYLFISFYETFKRKIEDLRDMIFEADKAIAYDQYGSTVYLGGFYGIYKYVIRNEIDIYEYANSIKELVGSDLYRYFTKDEVKFKKGGVLKYEQEIDTLNNLDIMDSFFDTGGGLFKNGGAIKSDEKLIVIHGIRENELIAADKLGGLAVPSLAVVKKGLEGNVVRYGDIILVGKEDLIDPKNPDNHTYDADAYTPTFPRIMQDFSPKKFEKIMNDIEPYAREIEETGITYKITENIEYGYGLSYIMDGLSSNYVFIYYWAIKNNIPIEIPKKPIQPRLGWMSFVDLSKFKNRLKYVKDNIGDWETLSVFGLEVFKSFIEGRNYRTDDLSKEDIDTYVDYVYKEDYEKQKKEGRLFISNALDFGKDFVNYFEPKTTIDYSKFYDILQDIYSKNKQEIVKFYKDLFAPAFHDTFYFFDGKKRVPYNLENVVEFLTRGIKAKEKTMVEGLNKQRARAAYEFKSINEMRSMSDKITGVSDFNTQNDKFSDEFFELAERFLRFYKYKDDFGFERLNGLATVVGDIMMGKNAKSSLLKYNYVVSDDYYVDVLKDFAKRLKNSKVLYFEGKPQRAVSLDEFRAAIVPDGISEDALRIFTENGIRVIKYKNREEIPLLIEAMDDLYFELGGSVPQKNDSHKKSFDFLVNNKYQKTVSFHGDPFLVHFESSGQNSPTGQPISFAWVEDDMFVYDYSGDINRVTPKDAFYASARINYGNPKINTFSIDDAKSNFLRKGTYKNWEEDVAPPMYKKGGITLTGGLSEGMSDKQIADKYKISVEELQRKIKKGMIVEKEHTDNFKAQRKIARDHLVEDINYYEKLKMIEDGDKLIYLPDTQATYEGLKRVLEMQGIKVDRTIKEEFKDGGIVVGKRHSESDENGTGERFMVESTGEVVELEGGEIVINAESMNSDKLYNFEGKKMTGREIASEINHRYGGVKFNDGGRVSCGCNKFYYGGELPSATVDSLKGGEGVINFKASQSKSKYDFQGKKMTPREILSNINSDNGGKKF